MDLFFVILLSFYTFLLQGSCDKVATQYIDLDTFTITKEVTWFLKELIPVLRNVMIPLTHTQMLYHKNKTLILARGPHLKTGYECMLDRHAHSPYMVCMES